MFVFLVPYLKYWKSLGVLFSLGVFAIAAQILICRETMTLSQGNELTLGAILCMYLSLTAAGSFYIAPLFKNAKNNIKKMEKTLSLILLSLGLVFPLSIVAINLARVFLVQTPTELIPITPLLGYLLIVIAPGCLLLGALFPLMVQWLERSSPLQNAFILGYLFEALGSALGGLFLFLFVFPVCQPMSSALFLGVFLVFVAGTIFYKPVQRQWHIVVAVVLSVILLFTNTGHIHDWIKNIQWHGFHYVDGASSRQGYVEVIQNRTQYSIYENGSLLATTDVSDVNRDILKITQLQKTNVQSMLLLGGGLNGLLSDIASLNSVHCDYVEPNKVVLSFIDKYFMSRIATKNIVVHSRDDIAFIRQVNASPYDVIIMSKPQPNTLLNNRFYTVEYYQRLSHLLGAQGLFFFAVPSSAWYVTAEHEQYLASLYKSLAAVFPVVVFIPGEDGIFVASKDKSFVLNTGDVSDIDKKNYFDLLFRKNISLDQVQLEKQLRTGFSKVKKNHDFSPQGYIYNILQGTNYISTPFFNTIKNIYKVDFASVFFSLGGLCIVGLLFFKYTRISNAAYLGASFIIGLTSMTMQLLIMVVFQITYGYLFFQIGIMTAIFMLGLTVGSGIMLFVDKKYSFKNMRTFLIANSSGMIGLICVIFTIFKFVNYPPVLLFNVLSFSLGCFSGLFFLFLVRLQNNIAQMYGMDIFGAGLGALLAPLCLGLWGVSSFGYVLLLLNGFGLALILLLDRN